MHKETTSCSNNGWDLLFEPYTILGKIITRSIIPAVATGYTLQVEVPNGAYIISIISDDKVIVTRKVSVQN